MDQIWERLAARDWTDYIICLSLFIAAYVLYRILFSLFKWIVKLNGFRKVLIGAIRYPILVIFYEIAAILSLRILEFKGEVVVENILLIISILTGGWLVASLIHTFFRYFMMKYEKGGEVPPGERSFVTQVLFLYRLLMLLIIVVTIAFILLKVPHIKSIGIGILGSAGILGIALGIAARPILLNLMSGFQIAMTKTIKIGDAVFINNEFSRIEAIHLTHVIARTWDLRRKVFPISQFVDHPFENWDMKNSELLGTVFIYCDYEAPIDLIRAKAEEIIRSHPSWNKKFWRMQVTNCSDQSIELRIIMTVNDATSSFDLRCYVREKLIEFLREQHPEALPRTRYQTLQ